MEVISLSKDKVYQIDYNGKKSYIKKTIYTEVQNIKRARNFLEQKNGIELNGKSYRIKVPKLYYWDSKKNFLIMEECIGDNVELMLRSLPKRKLGVQILYSIMKFILNQNFYWHDFAPRNILFNELASEITFVDFERGITLDNNINKLNYFRENVYEEFVAFLLPDERPCSVDTIFSLHNEDDYHLNINNIKSNRIRLLSKKLGYSNTILFSQYLQMIKMLIVAEEPFENCENIEFPIVELERILAQDGYDRYISKVLEKNWGAEERDE